MLGMMENDMKIIAPLTAIAILVFFFFISIVISGLAISTANSWVLGGNFSDAWSIVWQKKFVVFGWSMLFFSLPALSRNVRK